MDEIITGWKRLCWINYFIFNFIYLLCIINL